MIGWLMAVVLCILVALLLLALLVTGAPLGGFVALLTGVFVVIGAILGLFFVVMILS